MTEGRDAGEASHSAAERRERDGFAEQRGDDQRHAREWDHHDAYDADGEHYEQHRHQHHRHDRRHRRLAGLRFERLDTAHDAAIEHQRNHDIEQQEAERDCPGPSESGFERERAPVEKALLDPQPHAFECREAAGDDLALAFHDRSRIASQPAGDDCDVAIDSRVRAELEIAEDCDCRFLYGTVDIGIAEQRNHTAVHRTGHVRVAEDRHDGIDDLALDTRVAEDGDHAIGDFPGRKQRIAPDVDDDVVAVTAPQVDAHLGFVVGVLLLLDGVACIVTLD